MLRSVQLALLPVFPLLLAGESGFPSPAHDTSRTTSVAAAIDRDVAPGALPAPALRGALRVLSYNVAALPQAISRLPAGRMQQIGPLLADYDIILVQEDFAEPFVLRAGVGRVFASDPYVSRGSLDVGDGLNRFSRFPFVDHERRPWAICHGLFGDGSDCLAQKGFAVATHLLAAGVELDVYNLHLDAGGSAADRAARAAQVDQLLRALETRSVGRAVLVAGDTNLRSRDRATLARLYAAGLIDACTVLGCIEPHRIDRILFRSSERLELRAERWERPRSFVDDGGRALSDHSPVLVELAWRLVGTSP